MDSRLHPTELVRLALIARRYFIEERSKSEIASEFGISRFKVARALGLAKASGVVRIEISLPAEIDADLSERLRARFGLRHALVVTTPDEPEAEMRVHLGEVAAGLLAEIVVEGDVLGLAWGRSINATTGALSSLARCTVVQMTGAAGNVGVTEDTLENVRAAAALSGGPAFPIYAPLIVDDSETASRIRRQPHVAEAFRRFDLLTVAMVAVGSWDPPNSQLRDSMSPEDRASLQTIDVRAEVCGILFNDDGNPVAPALAERTIAVNVDQLARVPEVIAVAGGRTKILAVRAVLRAGFVTSLVTDVTVASALLQRTQSDHDEIAAD